jgi:hypothetical protein
MGLDVTHLSQQQINLMASQYAQFYHVHEIIWNEIRSVRQYNQPACKLQQHDMISVAV